MALDDFLKKWNDPNKWAKPAQEKKLTNEELIQQAAAEIAARNPKTIGEAFSKTIGSVNQKQVTPLKGSNPREVMTGVPMPKPTVSIPKTSLVVPSNTPKTRMDIELTARNNQPINPPQITRQPVPQNNPLSQMIASGRPMSPEQIQAARTFDLIESADNTGNRVLNDLKAGFGGVLSSAGGVAQRFGAEGIGKEMQERGDRTAAIWGQTNPNIGDDIVQSLPFMLSLMPAMMAGGQMGAGIGAVRGAGTLGKAILGSAGATAVSRPIESLLEAGGTYNDARARGLSAEEAEKVAERVFSNNMGLSIMDFAQLATAFVPAPANVKNAAIKALMTGGGKGGDITRFLARMGLTGAQEGLEEGIQAKIQTEALGDEFSWTSPETKRAMTVGAVFGAGMGTAGAAYQNVRGSVLKRMTPETQQSFNAITGHYVKQGMTQEQAEMKALDGLAKTPEGKNIIQQALPEAIEEFNNAAAQSAAELNLLEQEQAEQAPINQVPIQPMQTEQIPIEAAQTELTQLQQMPQIADQQPAITEQSVTTEQLAPVPGAYRVMSGPIARPENPIHDAQLKQRVKAPQVPTDITPGQKYTLKNFGEVEIVDASDLSNVIVKNKKGTEISIGRKAFDNLRRQAEVVIEPEAKKSETEKPKPQEIELQKAEPQKTGAQIRPVAGENEHGNANILGQGGKTVQGAKTGPTEEVAQKEVKSPVKYGRAGKTAYSKWGNNERVNAYLNKPDDPYTKAYTSFFDFYYKAGLEGVSKRDMLWKHPDTGEYNFPPFLEDEFYKAGQKDAEAVQKKANKQEAKKVEEAAKESEENSNKLPNSDIIDTKETAKEGETGEKPDKPLLDTRDEKGTSDTDRRLSSGADDDSVRSAGTKSAGEPRTNELQDTGNVPVQQSERRPKDQPADIPQTDSGLDQNKGPEGKTDGTNDSQDGQRRGVGEDSDGSTGRLSEEGEGKTNKNKVAYQNFRINEDNPVFTKGSKKTRYKANLDALKTLQAILDEGRTIATVEEQRKLALYSGWGALPEVFDYIWEGRTGIKTPKYKDWVSEFKETKELMEKIEKDHFKSAYNYRGGLWENAKASTMNAHFTSPDVISLIYQAVGQMGYKKGSLLEPSMGTGNFFGMIPDNMAGRTKLYGVELDPLTGSIAQLLYPNADIRVQGFQDVSYPDNYFDVAVGNVPFGDYKIPDNKYPSFVTQRIHNYFFAKTLDVVKPGGIVAYITSTGTLDAQGNKRVREYLSRKANFLGAIRLPGNAFKDNAGTEVTADIIFMQKLRDGEFPSDTNWTETTTYTVDDTEYSLNRYFSDNPDMVAGELVGDKLYNSRLGAKSNSEDIVGDIAKLIKSNLPEGIFNTKPSQGPTELPLEVQMLAADTLDGGIVRQDGKLYRKLNTGMVEIKNDVKQITKLIELRDLVKDVLSMQQDPNADNKALEAKRKSMKALYDGYVKQYGNLLARGSVKGKLHGRPHIEKILGYSREIKSKDKSGKTVVKNVFTTEPETYLFKSLEIEEVSIDEKGNEKQVFSPAQVLTERTYTPAKPVDKVGSAAEGLVASINEFGFVNMEHIAKIYGKTEEEIIKELGDGIYKNPTSGWETDDEYLSGNVRKKLEEVRSRVEMEPEYQRNIDALKKIIPEDVPITDIEVRLGDAWVPFDVTERTVAKILGINKSSIDLSYSPDNNEWLLSKGKGFRETPEMNAIEAGIGKDALSILKTAMNNGNTTITYKDTDGKTYTDNEKTNTFKAKVTELRQFLKDYIFENPDDMTLVERAYNDTFNGIVPRDYSKMAKVYKFNHLSKDIKLREHQKVAIIRALLGGNTLLAHGVGAGKTFEQIGIAMEAKNLGLANKPLLVVPNTKLTDFENDAKKMYPGAKILALSQDDFNGNNIKRTLALAAVNNWDMVIIRHSSFSKIPISPQTEIPALQLEIQELEEALASMTDESRYSLKRMENRLEKLREKLENYRQNKVTYKGLLYFEDMGFDMLIVDEAHEFKNYPLAGSAASIKGLQSGDASKARDMMIKSGHIRKINGMKRGLVFATGTPISNTMAEVYVMFKYLRPDLLMEAGISNFDAWADAFTDIGNMTEISAKGTFQSKKRFKGFVNLPELITMFKEFTDIKPQDDLNLPLPKHETITIECKPHPSLKDIMDEVQAGWDNAIKNKTLFRLINMVKTAPQDIRLVLAGAKNHPGSKINNLVKTVVSVYKETAKDKGTQAIFLTRGQSELTGFDFWAEIKKELVKKGIPANEIAYVKSGTKESDLEEIYRKVNAGIIRVVIGSYSKLGVGVNIQERLFAEHEVDVPYKPAELEQERGRMVRQGNSYFKRGETVRTYRYITKGEGESFSGDAFSWQIIEAKLKGINAMMKGDKSVRKMAAFDEEAGDAATMKAIALGDERWIKKIDLERDIAELNGAFNSFRSGQARAKSSMEYGRKRYSILQGAIREIKSAMETEKAYTAKKDPEDKTDIIDFTESKQSIDLKSKNGKKEAEKAIRKAIAAFEKSPRKNVYGSTIAKYHNLKLVYSQEYIKDWNRLTQKVSIVIGYGSEVLETTKTTKYVGKESALLSKDTDENLLGDFLKEIANFQKTIDKYTAEMETLNQDFKKYQDILDKPFKKAVELKKKKEELKALDIALGANEDIVVASEEKKEETSNDEEGEEEVNTPDPFAGETPASQKLGAIAPGFRVRLPNNSKTQQSFDSHSFENEDVEAEYRASYGARKQTASQKAKEGAAEFAHMFTRMLRRIDPKNPNNAKFIKEMTLYPKLLQKSGDYASRMINEYIKDLGRKRFNVFRRVVLLQDLMEEVNLGHELPGEWTPEDVQREWELIEPQIDEFIQKALDKRKAGNKAILDEYVDAMKGIGKNLEKKFTKENYFRHQVLDFMEVGRMAPGSSKAKVKSSTAHGWLRQRKGSKKSINTDYLQAEYEVLSQLKFEAEKAQMLKRVEKQYSIYKDCVKSANKANQQMINYIIEQELRDPDAETNEIGEPISPTDQTIKKVFNSKIARGFSELSSMAKSGRLWAGQEGKYDRVIDYIARMNDEEAMGYGEESHPDLFKYIAVLVKQDGEPGQMQAAMILKAVSSRKEFFKDLLSKNYKEWQDMIPDGYRTWQPLEGRAFYMVNTIPDQMAQDLLAGVMEEIGIRAEDIKTVMTMGKKNREYVLPVEIADTLDDIHTMQPQTVVSKVVKSLLSKWKGWTLTGNPHSVVKYNLRNISGDLDGVLAAIGFKGINPKLVNRATRELYDAMKNMRFTEDMREWWDRGGFQSLLYAQEVSDVNQLKPFRRLDEMDKSKASKILGLPRTYFEFTQDTTNLREGVLRYTAYLYYKEHLRENKGKPKYYGASIPATIDGLDTIQDKAFQLSNDALGAYDQVTEFGRMLRQYVIPFYSWNEINFKRYIRLFKNALNNEQLQKNAGDAVAKTMKLSGILGAKTLTTLGRVTLRVGMLSVMMLMWNAMWPDEEDDLPEDVRTKPHIILGRDAEGNVVYFSRLGALNDFLDWFGLDNLTNDIQDLQEGKKDAKEQASDMVLAPLNKLINGLTPYFMIPAQLMAGQSYYPDVRNPRQIRDYGEFASQSVGLTEEYKRLAGKPTKDTYGESWQKALLYKADPSESAYYYALDMKRKFEDKVQGKYPTAVFSESPKSKALYYFKQSLRFKDTEKAYKYINEYFNEGGTAKGIVQSLQMMNPLYGLDKQEQQEYYKWLNARDRDKVRDAIKYYQTVVQFDPKSKVEKQVYGHIENILTSKKSEEVKKNQLMPVLKAMTK